MSHQKPRITRTAIEQAFEAVSVLCEEIRKRSDRAFDKSFVDEKLNSSEIQLTFTRNNVQERKNLGLDSGTAIFRIGVPTAFELFSVQTIVLGPIRTVDVVREQVAKLEPLSDLVAHFAKLNFIAPIVQLRSPNKIQEFEIEESFRIRMLRYTPTGPTWFFWIGKTAWYFSRDSNRDEKFTLQNLPVEFHVLVTD